MNNKHKRKRKNSKKKQEQKSFVEKIKISFVAIVTILWVIVGIQLYIILKDRNSEELNTNETESGEVIPETLEEEYVESPATIFFTDYIIDLYSDYYDIISVRAIDFIPEDEEFKENDKFYFVTIEKQLKYTSVFQIPFVSGMKKAVDEFPNSKKAKRMYNKKTNELKTYIGKKQIEHNIFKVTFEELDNFENVKIQIATYHDKIPAETLKPPSYDYMVKDGYNFIKSTRKNKNKKISYNNDKAIRYADKYSSNPYKTGINQNHWNDDFKPYDNDCANYVSQCIYAGGMKKTSKWFPGSFYWIRTGSPKYANISGLTNYMQRIGKFYRANYSAVSAGGFICLIKESHVVFVSSNDSITILFNGHTNDRKRISFPHLPKTDAIYLNPNN